MFNKKKLIFILIIILIIILNSLLFFFKYKTEKENTNEVIVEYSKDGIWMLEAYPFETDSEGITTATFGNPNNELKKVEFIFDEEINIVIDNKDIKLLNKWDYSKDVNCENENKINVLYANDKVLLNPVLINNYFSNIYTFEDKYLLVTEELFCSGKERRGAYLFDSNLKLVNKFQFENPYIYELKDRLYYHVYEKNCEDYTQSKVLFYTIKIDNISNNNMYKEELMYFPGNQYCNYDFFYINK